MTTLHLAALNGSHEVTAQLLNDGVPIDLWESRYGTPLHAACIEGHIEVIKLLSERGADINSRGPHGVTCLSRAAYHGHIDAAAFLLSHGARIEETDDLGRTALFIAVLSGKTEVVRFLIQQGANINHMTNDGTPPLHMAIVQRHPEVVEVLLDSGVQLDTKGSDGYSAFFRAILIENAAIMQLFIDRGVDVNSADGEDVLPLFGAFMTKNKECIRLVLENGADLRKTEFNGKTIFHLAAEQGDLSSLQLLLEFAPSDATGKFPLVNIKNGRQDSPLHVATSLGHLDIVKGLVNAGAEIDITDRISRTPLFYASKKKQDKIYEYLVQKGATQETQVPVALHVVLQNGEELDAIIRGPASGGSETTEEECLAMVRDIDFGCPISRIDIL